MQGDAGAPLIQYVNGRAVLIGSVWIDQVKLGNESNCSWNETSLITFVRVSRKVDWIIEAYNGWKNGASLSSTGIAPGKQRRRGNDRH